MHMEPTKHQTIKVRGRDFPVLTQDEIRRRYLDDLPERLERFTEAAGLSWRELAVRVPGGVEALYPEFSGDLAEEGDGGGDGRADGPLAPPQGREVFLHLGCGARRRRGP